MTSSDPQKTKTMADEIEIALPEGSPVAAIATATSSDSAPTDCHKRKLEDLELSEPPAEPEPALNNNGTQEDGNESETKRPRLESNGETDGIVSQNGHQEEEKKIDESKEKESEQPDSANANVEGDEKKYEHKEEESEQTESADANIKGEEKKYEHKEEESERRESADANVKPVEDQEPPKEPMETITQEPVLDENEKTEIASTDEIGKPNAELEEPSQIPREGDVTVHSDERQSGSQILSRKMEVSNDRVGVLIGKAGDTIRSLQDNSGAKIQIMRDSDADPRSTTRPLELVGTLEDINKAERLIKNVIAEADAGGSPSLVARGFNTVQAASGGEQVEIKVPIEKVGLIIGKGGETIRNLQTRSEARIQLIQQNSDGEQSKERIVRITGNKKQIENAREMIKDVMNQTARPSPLSSGYSQPQQQGYRPRGPVASQWGSRGPHHAQFSGYDYPQRGSYPSQNSQYLPQSYGTYPPPQAPRSNCGPSWEQRPPSLHGPSPQGNYNYGQHPGAEYGHPPAYSQTPAQSYNQGYNETKYDNHAPPAQHYGPQPTPYAAQGGVTHSGYGPPQDQYGKPPMYGMQQQQSQVPHFQPYGQPRPTNHPGEVPYQGPGSSAQSYSQNMPPQQSYPYASSGPVQQSYPNPPSYGSAPTSDGYGHPPTTASSAASGYGQPVIAGYSQGGAQQPPPAYPQSGSYGSYPSSQPAYAEQQPAAANNAGYGYQAPVDPAAYGAPQALASYPATAVGSSGYAAQPPQTQPVYDQSGGYGNVAPTPVAGYGKSASPQPGYAPPQYDASQMYGHR